MKASTLLKAWAYAELGFIGYLLIRPQKITDGLPPSEAQAIEDAKKVIQEKIDAATQDP